MGEVSSRDTLPSVTVCMTIFVNAATTPNSTPTPTASRIARRQSDSRKATARQQPTNSRLTPATTTAGSTAPS